MDFGIKVSKPNYDVATADDKDLIFSSKFDTLRVFDSGFGSVAIDGVNPQDLLLSTHGLGYRPAFFLYSEVHSSFGGTVGAYYMMPFSFPTGGDSSIMPYVTDTEFRVRYGGQHTPSLYTLNYEWALLYNPAK